MKRILYTLIALATTLTSGAQIERAAQSVFTLTTFSKDGTLIASCHGVFTGNGGEAITLWKPLVGADHATVIDAKGNERAVTAVTGANEIYDVARITVEGKTTAAPVAATASRQGDKVWLMHYSVQKPQTSQRNIQSVETFMDRYAYYLFSSTVSENMAGCPFVNAKGEVIGLLQTDATGEKISATDASFINSLTVANGLAVASPTLKQTGIPTAYPADHDQAAVMLALAADQGDSLKYQRYIDAFITHFPTATEGYTARATSQMEQGRAAEADATMRQALTRVEKKDETHSAYARLIYQKQFMQGTDSFPQWTLDRALEEATAAYTANPQPLYKHQQGQILYTKNEFQQAYDIFMALTETNLRSGDLYYEAAQCKSQLKAPHSEVMALLDSAIAASPQPLGALGAPYVLARGTAHFDAGEYKLAVQDFNQYDSLMLGRPISSDFYHTRYQAEMQIRQYQQALNDISRAILMQRDSPTLWAEKASLHLRFNQTEDAMKSAAICTQIAPEYADGYILLGVASMVAGKKEEGTKALLRAKELGDPRADEYLKKYK